MNISNLLVNMSNSSLQQNGNLNLNENNGKNSFYSMLTMMMQDGNTTSEIPADASISDGNIMNMILNGNLNNKLMIYSNISNADISNTDISNTDISNLLQVDNKEDKSISSTEIDYNNLMNMLSGIIQNISYSDIQKLAVENEGTINNLAQGIQQNANLKYLALNENMGSNSKNIHEFLKSTISENSSLAKNSFVVEGTENKQQNNELYKALITSEKQNGLGNINLNADSLKEALVVKVNKSKENFKEEIDLSRGIVENKNVILGSNNKIIEVSDESSQIKTAVLSQIEDKIVVMANQKEETQQVMMELFPKNLGKVNIKMSMDAEKITVEIASLSEETGKILMSNIKELTSALQNTINREVNISVTSNKIIQTEQSNLNYSSQQSGLNYSNQQSGLNYGDQQSNKERNSSSYTFKNDLDGNVEDSNITEMMNLRNLKLNKVV